MDNQPVDIDPELQPVLARNALRGLDHLLTGAHSLAEPLPLSQIGAIIRLIVQADKAGEQL